MSFLCVGSWVGLIGKHSQRLWQVWCSLWVCVKAAGMWLGARPTGAPLPAKSWQPLLPSLPVGGLSGPRRPWGGEAQVTLFAHVKWALELL